MVYENMSIMNVTITGDVFNPARRYASITEKLHGKALLGGAATNVEILRLRASRCSAFRSGWQGHWV